MLLLPTLAFPQTLPSGKRRSARAHAHRAVPIFTLRFTDLALNAKGAKRRRDESELAPERLASSVAGESQGETAAAPILRKTLRFDLEAGTLVRPDPVFTTSTGTRPFVGGRGSVSIPLTETLSLRPSAGFFYSSSTFSSASASEQAIELGVAIDYTLFENSHWRGTLGVAQYGDLLFASLPVTIVTTSSPANFAYRLGGTAGLAYTFSGGFSVLGRVEVGSELAPALQGFASFTGGVGFSL